MTEDSAPKDTAAPAAPSEQPAAQSQPAPAFPHPDAAKKVEDAAAKVSAQVNTKALSVRQWLESAVVPVVRSCERMSNPCFKGETRAVNNVASIQVYQGMVAAAKERPDDPVGMPFKMRCCFSNAAGRPDSSSCRRISCGLSSGAQSQEKAKSFSPRRDSRSYRMNHPTLSPRTCAAASINVTPEAF